MNKEIKITKAAYLQDYKINLEFSDGKNVIIDFENFLKNAQNPITNEFLDKEKFKNYKLVYGDIIWGDYELCFPIWDLYQGEIEKKFISSN